MVCAYVLKNLLIIRFDEPVKNHRAAKQNISAFYETISFNFGFDKKSI
jgi:hypothetical protein